MIGSRWLIGTGLGVLCAAGIAVAPALGAQERHGAVPARAEFASDAAVGTFTPAAADPKLAALLARSGMPDSGFRFTPSEARRSNSRAVTVAVRARTTRGTPAVEKAAAPAAVSLTPIAYNLGVSVGWKRFAVSSDVSRVDTAGQGGSRQAMDVGVSYTGKRVSGRVSAVTEKPLTDAPLLLSEPPSYSIDVGGSYSLTRNLDVTAGVRYRSDQDNRLPQLTDNRRDSQAVYIGTAFRF